MRQASSNPSRGERGKMLARSPRPRLTRKFERMRVPAKNSASTIALSNPDIGPQSSPIARGHFRNDWLDSRHTFSFGQFHDPAWMGFGALRVINEDRVAPGAGFPAHGHANMEILSYVLDGALAHRDDTGGEGGVLVPGEVQWMGAGHGVRHSESNASDTEPVHFLQIWIQPDRVNARPGWGSHAFPADERTGRWRPLASPDGADGSLAMRQDARLHGTLLEAGAAVDHALAPGRRYWLHVARGRGGGGL